MLKGTLSSRFGIRKYGLMMVVLTAFILTQGLLRPAAVAADSDTDQTKKATEQATQTAKKEAEDAKKAAETAKKAAEEHAKVLKEIDIKTDPKSGDKMLDCHMRWVKHQDLFGLSGLDGDLAIQFHLKSVAHKDGSTTPDPNATMVISIFSTSGQAHHDNNGGTITVDDKTLTFASSAAYHTDNPMGVTAKGTIIEVIDFPISYDDFAAFANGKKIKGKIAGIDFDVKEFNLEIYQEMWNQTKATGSLTPVPTKKKKVKAVSAE